MKQFLVLSLSVFLLSALWEGAVQVQASENETLPKVEKRFLEQFHKASRLKNPKNPINFAFQQQDGSRHSLEEFKGRYLLVNFWATWCPPCLVELPSFAALKKHYHNNPDLDVIGISLDFTMTAKKLSQFLTQRNLPDLAGYYDAEQQIMLETGIKGLPTTYIFNPKGQLIYIFEGEADWASLDAIAFMDSVLKGWEAE